MNITLCDYKFDKDNSNVLLFNNKDELKAFFDNIQSKVLIENINFNARDIINTSVIVNVPNQLALFELLNYNYCFIEQENASTLYYFIEHSYQESGNQIRLELRLDAWNTYIYEVLQNDNINGLIQRTHLDRFKNLGNDTFIYDFSANSKLFERENIKNVAKRVTKQSQLRTIVDTTYKLGTGAVNDWIAENISGYIYFYLSGNVKYKVINPYILRLDNTTNPDTYIEEIILQTLRYKGGGLGYENTYDALNPYPIDSNFVVLSAPIYKDKEGGHKKLKLKTYAAGSEYIYNLDVSLTSLIKYINMQSGGWANVQAIKFSLKPPFDIKNYTSEEDYTMDEYGNLILNKFGQYNEIMYVTGPSTYSYYTYNTFFKMHIDDVSQAVPMVSMQGDFSTWFYTSEEIKNQHLEPKLDHEDYSTYRLLFGGNQYELPISKTSSYPKFLYKEVLTPDITKSILIYDTSSNLFDDAVFKNITEKDLTGFLFTMDLSMWFPNSSLDTFLANNKNNLQIFQNKQASNLINTASSLASTAIISTATLNPLPLAASTISSINSVIQYSFDEANYNLTIDNMRNSPDQTSAINSNPLFIMGASSFSIILEKLEALPFEQELIKDYLKAFGYTYNKLGNVCEYINTRKYFNYLQAIIYDIDAHISEQVKDKIKNIFANGVRVWHADATQNINFNLINYERSIENE